MRDLLGVTEALSDPNRVRIVACLRGGELCVCQILELFDLAPSTVSKHLSILRHARLIDCRKDGRWMHYRLADRDAPRVARNALRWVLDAVAHDKQVLDDARRLKEVLKLEPETLCCQQRESTKQNRPEATRSNCSISARETRAEARWLKRGRATSRAR